MNRYKSGLIFCAGIFMGFWDAVQMEGELALWHGGVLAVVTLACLWILTFMFTGLKKEES